MKRIIIHKGNYEKHVKPEDLDSYLAEGFELGLSDKHKQGIGASNKIATKNYFDKFTAEERKKLPNNYYNWKSQEELNTIEEDRLNKFNKAWSKKSAEELSGIYEKRSANWKSKSNAELKAVGDKHKSWWYSLTQEERDEMNKKRSNTLLSKTEEEKGIWVSKAWLTKKKNKSTNTSKPEELLYEKLLKENENKTIYRNYKCERYPYHCDFYIVEDDLFIELNAHWTHGGRPYDPTDYSCQKQLELWQEKAKTSKYWESAIKTWTVTDVVKAKCAKDNKLNYWVIY